MESKTYKVKCFQCGKSYQSDTRSGERIKKRLLTDPDYLKNYKCRACRCNPKAEAKPESKEKPEPKKKPKPEINIDVEFSPDMAQYIPLDTETYIERDIGGIKDTQLLAYHYTTTNKLMKNVLLLGDTGCMPGDTLVKTPEGNKPIKLVDEVLTYNLFKKCVESKLAIVHNSGKKRLVKLHTSQGIINCSPEHRWLVYRKGSIIEVMTKDIQSTDMLVEVN